MSLKSEMSAPFPDRHFFNQLLENSAVLLVIALLVFAARRDVLGAGSWVLGTVLSAANFWLLSLSIPKLLRPAGTEAATQHARRAVRRALFEFVIRYVAVGVVAYFAIHGGWVRLEPFALGLSLPIFALMIQAVRLTVEGLRSDSTS
ncbi:MAG: ATP synthase subunit I [Acidobacteriia bacterium]|nr:ATP synthase subunit I [Terriglobia bacterium]